MQHFFMPHLFMNQFFFLHFDSFSKKRPIFNCGIGYFQLLKKIFNYLLIEAGRTKLHEIISKWNYAESEFLQLTNSSLKSLKRQLVKVSGENMFGLKKNKRVRDNDDVQPCFTLHLKLEFLVEKESFFSRGRWIIKLWHEKR